MATSGPVRIRRERYDIKTRTVYRRSGLGTSNYAAVDTSTHQHHFRDAPALGIIFWYADAPSGREWNLGGWHPAPAFGMWNAM